MNQPPRKFSWSWSRLDKWRSCPKRHYHLDIAKDIPEQITTQLKWGKEFHTAMQNRIDTGKMLPKEMARFNHWPDFIYQNKQRGVDVRTELQMALTKELQPTEWFADDTWFRGIIDVLMIDDEYAVILDWKTGGKIKPEMEQLGLFAQLAFSHYDIETVHTAYQWAQHNDVTLNEYRRGDMVPLWNRLLPEVKQMEEATETLNYPPKPGPLCINYCPVVHCPYHGRGTRTA